MNDEKEVQLKEMADRVFVFASYKGKEEGIAQEDREMWQEIMNIAKNFIPYSQSCYEKRCKSLREYGREKFKECQESWDLAIKRNKEIIRLKEKVAEAKTELELQEKAWNTLADKLRETEEKKDGACYYCGEKTNSFAGNPGLWPVRLCHVDEPGKAKYHHAKCISIRLANSWEKRTVEEMEILLCRSDCCEINGYTEQATAIVKFMEDNDK